MTPINGNEKNQKKPKLHSQFPHFVRVCAVIVSCIVRFFAVSLFVFFFPSLREKYSLLWAGL